MTIRRPLQLRALWAAGLVVVVLTACGPQENPAQPTIEVWRSPNCECCSKWIQHLRANGFNVSAHGERDMNAVRKRFGVPQKVAACHTGTVGGYVIEGHVPAEDIKRLLAEKPSGRGLAVPGMPVGSPGMEYGDRHDPYEVLLFSELGEPQVFARH